MKIALYADNTLPLTLDPFCKLLNSLFKKIKFVVGKEALRIDVSSISVPDVYENLPKRFLAETAKYDQAIMCTNVPYENNYFFEGDDNRVLISFSGWNLYTDLPLTNGLVYFILSLLTDLLDIGKVHNHNVGCINDFWWDKTGVDVGMRAAFICGDCKSRYKGDPQHLKDIQSVLDLICRASRMGIDVISLQAVMTKDKPVFDVFLCHNSQDKPSIRKINKTFQKAGLVTWLDEEQLHFGSRWQRELQKQIKSIRNACVFIGKQGRGPWQDLEIEAFLSQFVKRRCRVIPVLLPCAPKIPRVPFFLEQMTWVDLRKAHDANLSRLISELKQK